MARGCGCGSYEACDEQEDDPPVPLKEQPKTDKPLVEEKPVQGDLF